MTPAAIKAESPPPAEGTWSALQQEEMRRWAASDEGPLTPEQRLERYLRDQRRLLTDAEREGVQRWIEHAAEEIRADPEGGRPDPPSPSPVPPDPNDTPLPLVDYLQLVEEHVFSAFTPADLDAPVLLWRPTSTATHAVACCIPAPSVARMLYPRVLQPWAGFDTLHDASFRLLRDALGDDRIESLNAVNKMRAHVLEHAPDRAAAAKVYLRAFLAIAIEQPASAIVNALLGREQSADTDADAGGRRTVVFQRHGYELIAWPPGVPNNVLPHHMADRWAFVHEHGTGDTICTATLAIVGKYKTPGQLRTATLQQVLAAQPEGDQFFQDAIRASALGVGAAPATVAKALCEAYHSMVSAGCGFGYIALGDSLVFLRVPQDTPDVLVYHFVAFPVPAIADDDNRRQQNAGRRRAQDTAAAYMTSFCLWALDTAPRPAAWIEHVRNTGLRWPATLEQIRPPSLSTLEAIRCVPPPPPPGERPTLPYCTQACLLGLVSNLSLDSRCPNVAQHKAAREIVGTSACATTADGHPLCRTRLLMQVLKQLTLDPNKDAECLDKHGHYGRFGVLFKITVTGFGYTFVAKAVSELHRHVLLDEAAAYCSNQMVPLQGRLVPVFLGMLALNRPIPRMHTATTHMMLLSFAGTRLELTRNWPAGVRVESEIWRSQEELKRAGIQSGDMYELDAAWNEEAGRVMLFDFDQASIPLTPPVVTIPMATPAARSWKNW